MRFYQRPNVHRFPRDESVSPVIPLIRPLMISAVGVGLTFSLNAAPLLLIELAYPTQVRHYFPR